MSSSSLRWSSGPWWLCGGWAETPAVLGVRSALHGGTLGTDSSPYSSSWSQSSSPPGPESQELNEMRHAGKETDTQTDQFTDIKEFSDTDGHTDIYIDRHIYTGGQTGIWTQRYTMCYIQIIFLNVLFISRYIQSLIH